MASKSMCEARLDRVWLRGSTLWVRRAVRRRLRGAFAWRWAGSFQRMRTTIASYEVVDVILLNIARVRRARER